jgi:RimJ/RimL family protein N-acetyltransferase
MASDDQTIATRRTVLHPLTLAQMESVLDGGIGTAAGCADYPPEGTVTGLGIRVQRLRRGETASIWFQIVSRSDGLAVGDINLHDPPDERGEVVVGIDLAPSARRQGLGTEVLTAAVAWALARPDVRSVRAEIDQGNTASQRMAEKAGMQFAGVFGTDRHYVAS